MSRPRPPRARHETHAGRPMGGVLIEESRTVGNRHGTCTLFFSKNEGAGRECT